MIKIIIKETTRNSSNPTFYYKVEREDKPTTRKLPDGTVIVNKYKIKSHKCSADEDPEMKLIKTKIVANSKKVKPVKDDSKNTTTNDNISKTNVKKQTIPTKKTILKEDVVVIESIPL